MSKKDVDLKEVFDLFERARPAFARAEQVQHARELRNQTTAGWLDNFINTMQLNEAGIKDPSIDKTTGIKHTVESMVQELTSRVGLDALHKHASSGSVALSKKAKYDSKDTPLEDLSDEEVLKRIQNEVYRLAIGPTSGYVDVEVLLNIVKENFGNDIVERFGREPLSKFLAKLRDDKKDTGAVDALPKYDGSPIPIGSDANEMHGNSNVRK